MFVAQALRGPIPTPGTALYWLLGSFFKLEELWTASKLFDGAYEIRFLESIVLGQVDKKVYSELKNSL